MYQFQPQHGQHGQGGHPMSHQSKPFIASPNQRTRASAAIPIVAPPAGSSSTDPTSPTPSSATVDTSVTSPSSNARKPCRNVAIYGHCRYEGEGCPFDHATGVSGGGQNGKAPSAGGPSSSPIPASSKAKLMASGASLPNSPLKGALSARNAAAAVFVPKSSGGSSTGPGPAAAAAAAATSQAGRKSDAEEVIAASDERHDERARNAKLVQHGLRGRLHGECRRRGCPHVCFRVAVVPPLTARVAVVPPLTRSRRRLLFDPALDSAGTAFAPSQGSAFDPTYAGAAMPGQDPSMQAGTPSHPPAPRAFNPYEHMTEFGDPTGGPGGAAGGLGMGGGLDFYAGTGPTKLRQPLQYHLYAPPLPHVSNLHPHHLSAHAFFLSPNQREELQRKQEAMHASVPPPELGGPNLPEELHVYHSLVPLEHPGPGAPAGFGLPAGLVDPRMGPPGASGATGATGDPSKVFGYRSHCYKAICTLDGKRYVLRRLEGFRLQHEAAISLVEKWRRIRHPSIVSVREAFTTRAFGDQSIVFVYDYHPLSTTLYSEHMTAKPPQPDRRTGRLQPVQMQVPERVLWSYLCQLTNVVRCIHLAGMAARCIEPSKVLRTGKNRVRLNCCSIFDVIAYDPQAGQDAVRTHQREDLANLGKLMLSLALNTMSALQNVPNSLESVGQRYSAEFKDMILWLLDESTDADKTADELERRLGTHVAEELDSALNYGDLLENALMKELENGRLVRLLCKFGFINERPEFDHDPRWAETGDRYIIKLFRDHVFHAVDEAGRPVVDLSHILTNLNKLDAGVDEKIMLTSRDEQSCLVVSYREIKNCVESAFQDLSRAR
ncbi:related to Pab1 dependent poly(A)-specific ribonuclease PAN3 [Pseudozyma flocculosa]|uniref:PAN2-PAN3 deadenylation complex subunit PAN3 n=1 Tax=Pseudozyma flocculosa TaxID=84751 RepID=A0A5C3EXS1_9BASI|nr:related to Pab1 dependent poly(A)-specific ribonuclease PAN3 [Pseudozyma flocculosa]